MPVRPRNHGVHPPTNPPHRLYCLRASITVCSPRPLLFLHNQLIAPFRLAGFLAPILDTSYFVSAQVPSRIPSIPLTATSQVLALQLGNVYGLLGMIGVGVLYFTSEAAVVKNFLLACAIADVGHLWATYHVIGYANFIDVKNWNQLAWGNIGVTAFLLLTRVLYLSGAFGRDRVVRSARKAL